MRVEYLVSRFPRTSETFIVRELDRLSHIKGVEVGLWSLFSSPDARVHEIARPWVERLIRPRTASVLTGVAWASWRHPRQLMSVVTLVVRRYGRKPGLLMRALLTCGLACAHARGIRPADTHLHAHYASYPALAAWVCHRLVGVGYSFTAHAHDIYVDRTMLAEKVAAARFVATISRYNQDLLKSLGTGTPIELVHCGIDTAAYPYRQPRIPQSGTVRALCVASLQEYKGHAVLLRALRDVPRLHLDLIGDGPLRGDLEELADHLGVVDRVRFLGAQDEQFVREALASAQLFVLPSIVAADGQMEGLPVALVEALACGVPVVSTNISGIPELVVDGCTGRLAEAGDETSLSEVLRLTLSDHERVAAFAEAGRALVEREFELDIEVEKLSRLFKAHA